MLFNTAFFVSAVALVSVSAAPLKLSRRAVDPNLVPQFGISAGVNPTGTGDCDGVTNAAGVVVKIPCSCPPNRDDFIAVSSCFPDWKKRPLNFQLIVLERKRRGWSCSQQPWYRSFLPRRQLSGLAARSSECCDRYPAKPPWSRCRMPCCVNDLQCTGRCHSFGSCSSIPTTTASFHCFASTTSPCCPCSRRCQPCSRPRLRSCCRIEPYGHWRLWWNYQPPRCRRQDPMLLPSQPWWLHCCKL